MKCSQTWELVSDPALKTGVNSGRMTLSNFFRHVTVSCKGKDVPKKSPGFKCNICGAVFPQIAKLNSHPCSRMTKEPEETYVTYTLRPNDCPLSKMVIGCKDLSLKQKVCYSEQIAIPGVYPWIFIPTGGLRQGNLVDLETHLEF